VVKYPLANYLSAATGALVAMMALEFALRPLASADLPPIARPRDDSINAPVITTRQLEEGIAVSHFSAAGARLTGNSMIPNAPVIVILGDSHVVAREITDGETMGAWVERLSRAENHPLNVRQYGWRGASPPQYLAVAKDVLVRWHPSRVVIVLDGDDLGPDPLNRRYPRMKIGKDDAVEIVNAPPGSERVATHRESTLETLFRLRTQQLLDRAPRTVRYWLNAYTEVRGPEPDSASLAAVPRAEVKALAHAFGPDVLLVYTTDVRVTGGEKTSALEKRLMDACAQQHVECLSMRKAMLEERKRGIVVRGFPTTTLGVGHLNAKGHELVGRAIWSALRGDDFHNTSQIAQR
jgi:hypothetical protein